MHDAEVLAALEFTPQPTCECTGCGGCSNPAEYTTKIHAMGFCTQLGLDNGMALQLLCKSCMSDRAMQIGNLIHRAPTTCNNG